MATQRHCPGFEKLKSLDAFTCKCPNCGKEMEVFSDELDRKHVCPECGNSCYPVVGSHERLRSAGRFQRSGSGQGIGCFADETLVALFYRCGDDFNGDGSSDIVVCTIDDPVTWCI